MLSRGDTLLRMTRVLVDPGLVRREVEGFAFPLGVYPVGALAPKPGFVLEFEPADEAEPFLSGGGPWGGFAGPGGSGGPGGAGGPGGGEGGWSGDSADAEEEDAEPEQWPDRFMFDILVPATRVRALWKAAATLLPPRAFPILDVLGNDAYREIDPYIAFEMVGIERLYDGIRWFEDWLFEDGLVGFGAMSLDPFVYLFLDEHKILTIRVSIEMKDRVEKLLTAMELEEVEEIVGADAAEHEHTAVLVPAREDNDALSVEEIIERLRDLWSLQLNIDPTTNVDDNGKALGLTAWRCVVRCFREDPALPARYADVLLVAGSLDEAEQVAVDAAASAQDPASPWAEITPVAQDRVTSEEMARLMQGHPGDATLDSVGPRLVEWLDLPPTPEPEPGTRPRPHPQGEPRTGDPKAPEDAQPDSESDQQTGDQTGGQTEDQSGDGNDETKPGSEDGPDSKAP